MNNISVINDETEKWSFFKLAFVFFIIYLSSSFSLSVYTGAMRLCFFIIYFIIMLYYALFNRCEIKIPAICIPTLGLAMFSYFVNFDNTKYYTIIMLYYGVALLFIIVIDIKTWFKYYLQIMYIIALCSLIMYAMSMFAPSLINLLPETSNSMGLTTHTVFIALSPINARNQGPFWEPGAFQTYLAIAIIIEIFAFKVGSKFRLTTLILAMITTFSSAGYIVLMGIILCTLVDGMLDNKITKQAKYLLIIGLFGIIISNYIIVNFYPHLYYTLIGKLENFSVTNAGTSAGTRATAIYGGLKVFWENMLTGVGITKYRNYFLYNYGHTMTTCTYVNWFAVYGIFYGSIMCAGAFKFTKYFSSKTLTRLLLTIVIFLSISSEDYLINPSILIMWFFGFANKKRGKNDEGS